MKFEELETLWTAQPPVVPLVVDVARIEESLQPELRRRSRMLGYEVGAALLAVVLLPVLSLANYLYDPARYGSAWQWIHVVCQCGIVLLMLRHAVMRLRRHRALRRHRVDNLREMTRVSLANLEAEMRDYRWQQPVLWLLGVSVLAAIVRAGLFHGWSMGVAAGGGTAVLLAIVGVVLWRHHRVNLRPAWERQREILRELE